MYYIYIHAQIVKIILSATYKQVNFSLAVSGDDATRAFENEKRYWNYTLRKCNEPWKKCGHYKLVNFFLVWYTHEWLFIHPGGGWNSFASMSLTTRILFFFLSFVVNFEHIIFFLQGYEIVNDLLLLYEKEGINSEIDVSYLHYLFNIHSIFGKN